MPAKPPMMIRGEVIGRVLGFLCRWLIFHILGTDMRMAKEILALQAGVSPAEARLQAADHMKDANEVLLEAMDVLYANLADRTHDFWQANHQLHVEIDEHQKTMRELRKLSRAVEGSPVPVMMTDTEGCIEYVNEKFCQVNGYAPAEVLGRMPSILKSGTMPDETYRALWAAVADGGEWFGEMQNRRKDGSLYWARMSVSPLTSVDGEITHYLAFSEDISAQKQVEEEIRHANAHLEASNAELQRQTRDLTLLNRMNEMLQACLTAEEAYGVIAHMASELELGLGGALTVTAGRERFVEVVARWGGSESIEDVFSFDDCCAIRRGKRHEVTDEVDDGLQCKHFSELPVHGYMCIPLLVFGETLGLLHVLLPECSGGQKSRLTQLSATVAEAMKLALSNIRLREALHDQAIHDPLTGLFNRRYLDETLAREMHRANREALPLSILMIDIDHFKRVNDQYGHKMGDLVLVRLAEALVSGLRSTDIACRFGGEEFVVIMPDADAEEAARRMQDIAIEIRALQFEHGPAQVTVSVGVASIGEHCGTVQALVRAADHAMYAAKESGRDRICVAAGHEA